MIILILVILVNCASTSDEHGISTPNKRVLITAEEYSVIKRLRAGEKTNFEDRSQEIFIVPFKDPLFRKAHRYASVSRTQLKNGTDEATKIARGMEGDEKLNFSIALNILYTSCGKGEYCKYILYDDENDGVIDYIVYPEQADGGKCKAYLNPDATQKSYECNYYDKEMHLVKRTIDIIGNGKPNQIIFFDPKRETKSEYCFARIDYDNDSNGNLDRWDYYENCKLSRREIDENENGIKEEIIYYNQAGEPVRTTGVGKENTLKASVAVEAKKYDQAIEFYQAANQELTNEWGADTDKIYSNLFQLTIIYMEKKDFQKCITTTKQISEKKISDDAKSYLFYYSGTCQLNHKNYTQADKDLESSIKFAKSNEMKSNAHYNFACSLSLQSKGNTAIDHLKKAISFSPNPNSTRRAAKTDSDFTNIINDPEFKKLVE